MRWAKARRLSNIDGELEGMTFSTFHAPRQQAAFDAANQFCHDPKDWLVFIGGNGTGKTHLLAAIAHRLISERAANRWPLYCFMPSLVSKLRRAIASGDSQDELERLMDVDVLLLDDLGAEQETAWSITTLTEILDHRYRQRMPTVIATNIAPTSFPARIASRMMDRARVRLVVMGDSDYRLSKERAQERA